VNKSSRKNPSAHEAKHPGPRFAAGLCPLFCSRLYLLFTFCYDRFTFFHYSNPLASAEKLRAKSGKTMVGSAAAGHSKYLQK